MTNDKEELLAQAKTAVNELRERLVRTITPADISRTDKVSFRLRVFRELLIHRAFDLGEVACRLYHENATIPAMVLTRAAFETMAMLFDLQKSVDTAIKGHDVEALKRAALRAFGCRNKTTEIEAVNIMTVVGHLEKEDPGFVEDFKFLCEFAHPNHAGLVMAYESEECLFAVHANVPVPLGPNSALKPDFGIACLCETLLMTQVLAIELPWKDMDVARLCEGDGQ